MDEDYVSTSRNCLSLLNDYLHVLLVVAENESELSSQDIAEISDVPFGTLGRLLRELESEGMIDYEKKFPNKKVPLEDRRKVRKRRYYEVTDKGYEILNDLYERIDAATQSRVSPGLKKRILSTGRAKS